MTSEKLSIKKISILTGFGIFVTDAIFLSLIYNLTGNLPYVLAGFAFCLIMSSWLFLFAYLIQNKLALFTQDICNAIDKMISDKPEPDVITMEETLSSKINHRMKRLYEIVKENRKRVRNEKTALQELISDISHQVRMPIANLKIVNAIMLEKQLSSKKETELLQAMDGQLDKLTFLMDSLIKTSRLESGVIVLNKQKCFIYDTLAEVLGSILLAAEKKNIEIHVDCDLKLEVLHDRKWTSEALFNLFDNAVKYTPCGGKIQVSVMEWEMYTKIDITDTGKGIAEIRQAEIFKRFYREEEVHDMPGIGIGLYLARKIITMQGGYIKVISEASKGSTFSVFLPIH